MDTMSRWSRLATLSFKVAKTSASTVALVAIGCLTAPLANTSRQTSNTPDGERSPTRPTTTQHLMDQLKDHPDLTSFPSDPDGLVGAYEQIEAQNRDTAKLLASFYRQLISSGIPSTLAGELVLARVDEMFEDADLETCLYVDVDEEED